MIENVGVLADTERSPARFLAARFFDRKPIIVAKQLIGCVLVRTTSEGSILSGRIVETEAYLPSRDPAAHGARGCTSANKSLFMGPGTIYVHQMHREHCLDIVTQDETKPGSVLIRALEPVLGLKLMQHLRRCADQRSLTNGPGKLCQALGITKAFDGQNVADEANSLRIAAADSDVREEQIVSTGRVGLSTGVNLRLRFCLSTSPFLSRRC
jgi:DNA-3-methyladenine glycosylase